MNTFRQMFTAGLVLLITTGFGQSKTTTTLEKNSNDVKGLFFYQNTLRMFNQKDDKDFDELIKDIEKMKLLIIRKPTDFGSTQYKKLIADYKKESFEEAMTSRMDGKAFDIFLKEKDGDVKGMIVLVNDNEMLYVLDIVGFISLAHVGSLYKTLEESSDVTKILGDFTKDSKKDGGDHKSADH